MNDLCKNPLVLCLVAGVIAAILSYIDHKVSSGEEFVPDFSRYFKILVLVSALSYGVLNLSCKSCPLTQQMEVVHKPLHGLENLLHQVMLMLNRYILVILISKFFSVNILYLYILIMLESMFKVLLKIVKNKKFTKFVAVITLLVITFMLSNTESSLVQTVVYLSKCSLIKILLLLTASFLLSIIFN